MFMRTATGSVCNSWRALLLAVVLAGCSFLLQGRQGLNLADEGFLWYGVQQTAIGQVPLRDFQSYDPGRYYWGAAGVFLFGKGLVALRFSEAVFQAIGLWAGLLAASRVVRNWVMLVPVGLMLTLWMFPSHKLFDHTLLLVGIWLAVRLIEQPSRGRVFVAGLFVGLCAFFGRNHALYNFVADAGLLFLLCLKTPQEAPPSRLAVWLGGVIAGLTPILVMAIFVPGFFASYWESVASIFRHGTNLGLPILWPWRVSYSGDPFTIAHQLLFAVLLTALPIGYAAAIGYCIFTRAEALRENPLLVACAFVGLLYAHHAFSRADFSHLAQAIHPFTLGLVATLALFKARRQYLSLLLALLMAAALFGVGRQMPVSQRLISRVAWVPYDTGDKIFVPPNNSRVWDCLRQFVARNVPAQEGLLIAPFTPGLYPLLDRPSPLWDTYFFFPATEERQEEMIRTLALKNVNWAIISDSPLDHRDDLRFSSTHKLLWQYLWQNFEPVDKSCLPKTMQILHRKQIDTPPPDSSALDPVQPINSPTSDFSSFNSATEASIFA
jgi:hypothetical protein